MKPDKSDLSQFMLFIIFNVGSTPEDADEILLPIKITFRMVCFAKVTMRKDKTEKKSLLAFIQEGPAFPYKMHTHRE